MAIADLATAGKAVVDGFLKDINVPTINKITMKAVASRVTIGKDERLRVAVPLVGKAVGVIQYFEEDRNHMHWKGGRARTVVVVLAGRIRYVRLMIRRVKVLAIPAGREKDLSTKATRAVIVGETIGLGLISTQTSKADGLGVETTGKIALRRVTSKHAKTFGECM